MLAWFTRHQKSLMLILLVPALLAMGITGAVLSVLTYQAEPKAGRVFGQDVDQREIQQLRRLFGQGDEALWQFYAQLQFADQNGISVSRKEVGKNALPEISATINQQKLMEEWKAKNLSFNDPQGQAIFRQLLEKYSSDRQVSPEEYEKFLSDRGISIKEYEDQQIREARVLRLKEVLRDLATVTPAQVREKYQEEHHLRTLSLLELAAADYSPVLSSEAGSKHLVSQEQVDAYYAAHRADYDEPRQVDVHYLGLSFAAVSNVLPEVSATRPSADDLAALNKRKNICPVGSEAQFEDQLLEAYWGEAARREVARIMDAVADAKEAATAAKTPISLAALAQEVRTKLGLDERIAFEQGSTGLAELEQTQKVALIAGFASERWFRVGEAGAVGTTSDVLASDKGWFVLQNAELKSERTPPFSEVAERVKQDYVSGSRAERKNYYESHKDEFKQPQAYAVRWWYVPDDQAEGDHDKARAILEGALAEAKAAGDLTGKELLSSTKIKDAAKLRYGEQEEATEAELEKLPVIGGEAKNVGISPQGQFSRVFSYEGGWASFKLIKVLPPRYQELAEVDQAVAEKIALERAVERAETAANELLAELGLLKGDALLAKLKELGLGERETEPFARTATSLEGIADAARLVAEAFSTQAELSGPYFSVVPDAAGRRVFLVRANRQVDAPLDGLREEYVKIRADLLTKTRLDYQEKELRRFLLEAKGVPDEMVNYVLGLIDGPQGQTRVTFRQAFLPPDKDTIEGYLDQSARTKIAAAQQKLARGTAWATVVSEHSEHEATRNLAGELPALSREELIPEFGNEFVETVFSLPELKVSEPIKSNLGLHLVRPIKLLADGRRTFQHILVRMDPAQVPAEVLAKAKQLSRSRLEKALSELNGGTPFGEVAFDYGSQADAYGQGQELTLDFVTHFERAALSQYLQLEVPEGDPHWGEEAWVPEAVEVPGPQGPSYHLFVCDRPEYASGSGAFGDSRWLDRNVYHIAKSSQAGIEEVRQAFAAKRRELAQGDDTWSDRLRAFKALARTSSDAPTKVKGGALGLIKVEPAVQAMGGEFLKAVCYQADGSPVTAGYRTGLIESQAGFHLIEIVKVQSEQPEGKHRGQVAQRILLGTDWSAE